MDLAHDWQGYPAPDHAHSPSILADLECVHCGALEGHKPGCHKLTTKETK